MLSAVIKSLKHMRVPLLGENIRNDQSNEIDNLRARLVENGTLPVYKVVFEFLHKAYEAELRRGTNFQEDALRAATRMAIMFRFALTRTLPHLESEYEQDGNCIRKFLYGKFNAHYIYFFRFLNS